MEHHQDVHVHLLQSQRSRALPLAEPSSPPPGPTTVAVAPGGGSPLLLDSALQAEHATLHHVARAPLDDSVDRLPLRGGLHFGVAVVQVGKVALAPRDCANEAVPAGVAKRLVDEGADTWEGLVPVSAYGLVFGESGKRPKKKDFSGKNIVWASSLDACAAPDQSSMSERAVETETGLEVCVERRSAMWFGPMP